MEKLRRWFKGLSKSAQIAVFLGVFVFAMGIAGAMSGSPVPVVPTQTPPLTEKPEENSTTISTIKEIESIAYTTLTQNDPSLEKGLSETRQAGASGERTITYEVTYRDRQEVSRRKLSEEVTKKPLDKIVAIGTYVKPAPAPASSCSPNYGGACVPIASDVDCASGSGNGPAYVSGPVSVIGSDIYGLDRDGDGIGCE